MALWTKEPFPTQNRDFKNGVIVIGPEEMPILDWWRKYFRDPMG